MYGAEQSQQSGAARINRLNRHAAEIVTEINVLIFWKYYYLRQGRYAVVVVCLFVCLLATAQKLPNGFSRNFQGRLAMGHSVVTETCVFDK